MMATFFLFILFGVVGGTIGEYAFDQHCIVGTIIGEVIAAVIRLSGGKVLDVFADIGDGLAGGLD